MTRTAVRYTLCTLAAATLVCAFAGSPTHAEQEMEYLKQEKWLDLKGRKGPKGVTTQQPVAKPKGLATKKGSQRALRLPRARGL